MRRSPTTTRHPRRRFLAVLLCVLSLLAAHTRVTTAADYKWQSEIPVAGVTPGGANAVTQGFHARSSSSLTLRSTASDDVSTQNPLHAAAAVGPNGFVYTAYENQVMVVAFTDDREQAAGVHRATVATTNAEPVGTPLLLEYITVKADQEDDAEGRTMAVYTFKDDERGMATVLAMVTTVSGKRWHGSELWSNNDFDEVTASPVLLGRQLSAVLVLARTSSSDATPHLAVALNASNGAVLWRQTLQGTKGSSSIHTPVVTDDASLSIIGADCAIYALDNNQNGTQKWNWTSATRAGADDETCDLTANTRPLLMDHNVTVALDDCLYQLDVYTGRSTGPAVCLEETIRAPLALSASKRTLFVVTSAHVYGLKYKDLHKQRWKKERPTGARLNPLTPLALGVSDFVLPFSDGSMYSYRQRDGFLLWRWKAGPTQAMGSEIVVTSGGRFVFWAEVATDAETLFQLLELRSASTTNKIGCAKGFQRNNTASNAEASGQALCTGCAEGYYKEEVGDSTRCKHCAAGFWNDAKYASFCYRCNEADWCPHKGFDCAVGRRGEFACANCESGYFTVGGECVKCASADPGLFVLGIGSSLFFLWICVRCAGRSISSRLQGTQFQDQVLPGDQVFCDTVKIGVVADVVSDFVLRLENSVRVKPDQRLARYRRFNDQWGGARKWGLVYRMPFEIRRRIKSEVATMEGSDKNAWRSSLTAGTIPPSPETSAATSSKIDHNYDGEEKTATASHRKDLGDVVVLPCQGSISYIEFEEEYSDGPSTGTTPGEPPDTETSGDDEKGGDIDDGEQEKNGRAFDNQVETDSSILTDYTFVENTLPPGCTLRKDSLEHFVLMNADRNNSISDGLVKRSTSTSLWTRLTLPTATPEERGLIHGELPSHYIIGSSFNGAQIMVSSGVVAANFFDMSGFVLQLNVRSFPFHVRKVIGVSRYVFPFGLPLLTMGPECVQSLSYANRWTISVGIPILFCLAIPIVVRVVEKSSEAHRGRRNTEKVLAWLTTAGLVVSTLLYVGIMSRSLEMLDCTEYERSFFVMDAQPWIECTGRSEHYDGLRFNALCAALLFGVGVPATLFSILRDAARANELSHPLFRERFGFLFLRYHARAYAWEFVIIGRKFLVVAGDMLMSHMETPRFIYTVCIFAIALLAQVTHKPFICYDCVMAHRPYCPHWSVNDQLETMALCLGILQLVVLHIFFVGNQDLGGASPVLYFVGAIVVVFLAFTGYHIVRASQRARAERKSLSSQGSVFRREQALFGLH